MAEVFLTQYTPATGSAEDAEYLPRAELKYSCSVSVVCLAFYPYGVNFIPLFDVIYIFFLSTLACLGAVLSCVVLIGADLL